MGVRPHPRPHPDWIRPLRRAGGRGLSEPKWPKLIVLLELATSFFFIIYSQACRLIFLSQLHAHVIKQ